MRGSVHHPPLAPMDPQKKRRTWDQGPTEIEQPPQPPSSAHDETIDFLNSLLERENPNPSANVTDSVIAAQEAAMRANAILASKGYSVPTPNLAQAPSATETREIVINGYAPQLRAIITKGAWQRELGMRHSVSVISRGRYIAPGGGQGASLGEKPLHLVIEGPANGVNAAIEEIENRKKTFVVHSGQHYQPQQHQYQHDRPPPPQGGQSQFWFTALIDIGNDYSEIDPIPQIRGPNDQYINHISTNCGCIVSVSANNRSLEIKAPTQAKLTMAQSLAKDLVTTVRKHFGLSPVPPVPVTPHPHLPQYNNYPPPPLPPPPPPLPQLQHASQGMYPYGQYQYQQQYHHQYAQAQPTDQNYSQNVGDSKKRNAAATADADDEYDPLLDAIDVVKDRIMRDVKRSRKKGEFVLSDVSVIADEGNDKSKIEIEEKGKGNADSVYLVPRSVALKEKEKEEMEMSMTRSLPKMPSMPPMKVRGGLTASIRARRHAGQAGGDEPSDPLDGFLATAMSATSETGVGVGGSGVQNETEVEDVSRSPVIPQKPKAKTKPQPFWAAPSSDPSSTSQKSDKEKGKEKEQTPDDILSNFMK